MLNNIQDQIIKISEKSQNSVISIIATKDLPKIEGFYPMHMDNKNFMIPKFKKDKKVKADIGGGSGFIVHKKGIILTNSHVVEDPNANYTALLSKGETKEITVIARDPIHDIAICQLEDGDYDALSLGDSSSLRLGEYVIAVGNALGEFSNTVSLGIISGLSRFIQAQGQNSTMEHLHGLIQTDAAINPGNSGGPLINMDGNVIGINTAVIYDAQNLGFSIPIHQAKEDLEQVEKYGRIRIPFIGIRYIILEEEESKKQKLPFDYGALIKRPNAGTYAILKNSSAEKAGLKEYDIILEANNKKITPLSTLQDIIQEQQIGDTITMKVWREGKTKEIQIELEEKRK